MLEFFRLKANSLALPETFRGHAGWVGLLVLNLVIVLSLRNDIISPNISRWAPQLVLNLYLLIVYIFGQLKIKPVERYDFMQLIMKMALFGVIAASLSFFIEAVLFLFSGAAFLQKGFLVNAFYLLSLLLISTYLIILLVAYKRLILYEKSRMLLISWRIFEYSLIASMVLGVFNIQMNNAVYDIFLLALVGMGVMLSVNLKWVGYLDFTQKWRSMLMLLGIAGCLGYFAFFTYVYGPDQGIFLNIVHNVFVLALLAFCLFYTLLSCFVIFFNLPTSSVYEKKLQEIKGFHKLNRLVQNEEHAEKLLATLLENALSAVDAGTGWIELNNPGEQQEVQLIGSMDQQQLNNIIFSIKRPALRKVFAPGFTNPTEKEYFLGSLQHHVYRSMLVVPLNMQEKHVGLLVLLKDVEGAFNTDAIDLVKTYADHTCVSIENMRLLHEALQSERYKEEIAIARRVQRSILPEVLAHNQDFELAVYSESADEVGGDYYDTYQLSAHQYALIIADVAGHGTSAAFIMSQLKGVFHSLVQIGLSSKEFVVRANQALARCLDKATFITLTYIMIDTEKKEIEIVRAGHCPTLYFCAQQKEFLQFQNKGMGIGILRNKDFANYLQESFVQYQPGDMMVLYTDGVIECKNKEQEEFGMERLKEIIAKKEYKNVIELQKAINEEVQHFTQKKEQEDDFTTLLVRFN
jgi:sigma-B regulation protein RsbU (phosphoserine phosphatase)